MYNNFKFILIVSEILVVDNLRRSSVALIKLKLSTSNKIFFFNFSKLLNHKANELFNLKSQKWNLQIFENLNYNLKILWKMDISILLANLRTKLKTKGIKG